MEQLRYVAGVSWPRSGHHVLKRVLSRYFGPDHRYCEFYWDKPDCCHSFPCVRKGIHFSKNHDTQGSAIPVMGVPYLVQYRAIVPSTISDFELYVRNGNADTEASFRDFAKRKTENWARFVVKWVDDDSGFERLILRYEDLLEDPFHEVSRVVKFCAPDDLVQEDRVQKVVHKVSSSVVTNEGTSRRKRVGIKSLREVGAFRYYDPGFFAELEESAESQRRTLNQSSSR